MPGAYFDRCLTHREIAQRLGITTACVQATERRALHKLRQSPQALKLWDYLRPDRRLKTIGTLSASEAENLEDL